MTSLRTLWGRFKGYGQCSMCHNTWNWKEGKTIPYCERISKNSDHYSGMFPLCKECFESSTVGEIVFHCKLLLQRWISSDGSMDIIKNFDKYMKNIKYNVERMKK